MSIIFTLNNGPKYIQNEILKAFRRELLNAFTLAAPEIKLGMEPIVVNAIQNTPEYRSIADPNGQLLGELGLEQPGQKLNVILQTIVNSIQVKINRMNINSGTITGGLTVNIIRRTHNDILSLASATYVSTSAKGSFNIDWLKWLLTEGNSIIIVDHRVTFDPNDVRKGNSRTGLAVMKKPGRWKVPTKYSGIIDDNFITRAFNDPIVENLILDLIRDKVLSHIH